MTASGSMYSTSFGGDENTLGFSGDGWTLFEYTKKKKTQTATSPNCINLQGKFYTVQIRPK